MGLREKIDQNPNGAAIVAVAVLVVAGLVIAMQMGIFGGAASGGTREAYFLDTGSGMIYRAGAGEMAPIKAPSGKDGVRAYIYSCNECADDYAELNADTIKTEGAFLAYTERLHPKMKAKLEKARASGADPMMIEMQIMQGGMQYGNVTATKWVGANSPGGYQVVSQATQQCAGERAKQCVPR
ncbi:hypothetical protein KS4_22790 [Poriferisphaera corsica]|uniref:Uncharacterized protein n=1 Tax=Poriferisphaera corsica TaxID=2528020 RepID=A0A517YVH6_9BACT|nr:hypothetical protein [Poriferisphaera corsica]QDU34214.1 hypothetical protein KS4_22790 [Poriferisphaera corsica]